MSIYQRSVRLEPLAAPPFLGGLPAEDAARCQVPADSVYGRLACRPAHRDLPGVHSRNAEFASEELKNAYMKIYHGDCTLVFSEMPTVGEGVRNVDVSAGLEVDPSFEGTLMVVMVEVKNDHVSMTLGRDDSSVGQAFYSSLTQGQRETLACASFIFFFGHWVHFLMRRQCTSCSDTFKINMQSSSTGRSILIYAQ